jgi:hypothetical protein
MSSRNLVAPLIALAAASVLTSGCGADPLNVVVLSARAPGNKCDFSDDTLYVARGSLDLRPYVDGGQQFQTQRYYQVFSWRSNLTSVPITVNGQVVDPASGNDFVADSVHYEYQYSDPNVVLAPEAQNMRAVITAGGNQTDNSVPADLIQPGAFAAINASNLGSAGQTLLVTFQIFGKLAAGGSKHTNKVSFPLTVYRSSTTALDCGASGLVPNGGVCGVPGRDQDVSCTTP